MKPNALSAGGRLPPVVVVIVAGVRPIPVGGIPVRVASVSVDRVIAIRSVVVLHVSYSRRRCRFESARASANYASAFLS